MRRRLRLLLAMVAALSLLALPVSPAGAHDPEDTHPPSGGHDHTEDEHSQNMKLMSHVPRSTGATQSDLAFWGNYAFAGNYDGFRVIDVSAPGNPKVVADVLCPGPQNDISVWEDLIVISVDTVMADDQCGSPALEDRSDPTGWEGLRIFSLEEVLAATPDEDGFVHVQPVQTVYTDCGSHTHTLIPDPDEARLIIYVSSYPLRLGPTCGPGTGADDPLHRKISVVEVSLDDLSFEVRPAFLREGMPVWDLLAEAFPGVFNPMVACHDIQVFVELGVAAAACASEGQLWDISDPANPDTENPIWFIDEPSVQFYHSAAFTWDGAVTIFGDEVVVGSSCQDPSDMHGRLWFYDTDSEGELEPGDELSSFLIPRMQPGQYCSAHLFNVLQLKDRYVMVSSWYRGGTSVIDFTDVENPREVGFYDPANTVSGHWSAYWYNGFIYANDIDRGFDVFRFSGREAAGARKVAFENPQSQLEIFQWPGRGRR